LQTCQGSGVGSIPIGRSIKIKQLRKRLIFHIFQNYNLIANLGGKFGLYVLKRNLPSVKRRHRSGRVPHLLAKDGGVNPGEFPPAVAPPTKGVHSGLF
jgi:hypothetical protein